MDEPVSESEWLDAFGELLEPEFWEVVGFVQHLEASKPNEGGCCD